jgi:UDP-glucose 4-epimerase
MAEQILVTGAAGFIGSQLVDRLLAQGAMVIGADNFCRGTEANLAQASRSPAFRLLRVDLADLAAYRAALEPVREPIRFVWHLAANSDIPAGVSDPGVDFRDTFLTTYNTLLVMRERSIRRLAFASTSAVYGDGHAVLAEDTAPLLPISNYGAMKLASEAAISAAVESHLERAWIFRFPNVVGSRATHGIIYDLLRKIRRGGPDLEVLGDGTQCKQYLHAHDLIDAMLFICGKAQERRNLYNIGPDDMGITVREIAEAVIAETRCLLPIRYTGGAAGWLGDVPRFRYSIEKLKALGWTAPAGSHEAVRRAVAEIHREMAP